MSIVVNLCSISWFVSLYV